MLGQHFREIFYFWARNLAPIFLICAPFALLNEAIQLLLGPALTLEEGQPLQVNSATQISLLLLMPLAEGALLVQLAAIQAGKPRGLLGCVAPAVMLYPALLATHFLIGAAVLLGLLAFIFPGLWFYTRLCFAPFQVMLRQAGPLQALKDAVAMSERLQWPLLITIVLFFLILYLGGGILSGLFIGLLGDQGGTILAGIVISVLAALINVAVFRYWTLAQE